MQLWNRLYDKEGQILYSLMKYVLDCCVQLLIMRDGEWHHTMGSPTDGTPPQSEDQ